MIRSGDRDRAPVGARFDIRDFHPAVRGNGAAQPALVEAPVDAGIRSENRTMGSR